MQKLYLCCIQVYNTTTVAVNEVTTIFQYYSLLLVVSYFLLVPKRVMETLHLCSHDACSKVMYGPILL